MVCCFGDIVVGIGSDLSKENDDSDRTGRDLSLHQPQMILNEYGKIAEQQWYWLAEQYSYIELHEFIVMPNHIHGIIEINGNAQISMSIDVPNNLGNIVRTGRNLSVK